MDKDEIYKFKIGNATSPWDEVTTLRLMLDDAFDYADHAERCVTNRQPFANCDCGFVGWFDYCSKLLGYDEDATEET